jgi:hypothetical protein
VSLFVDTSFVFALADEDDADHERARKVFESLDAERLCDICITTNHVVAETITLEAAQWELEQLLAARVATSGARLRLQVLGTQPSVSGNSRQHDGSDLVAVMEGSREAGPAWPNESAVGAGGPGYLPSGAKESGQDTAGLARWPAAHAAATAKDTSTGSDGTSPCSSLSAKTRRARA